MDRDRGEKQLPQITAESIVRFFMWLKICNKKPLPGYEQGRLMNAACRLFGNSAQTLLDIGRSPRVSCLRSGKRGLPEEKSRSNVIESLFLFDPNVLQKDAPSKKKVSFLKIQENWLFFVS